MDINARIPNEELTFITRVDFLAEVAETMSKEANETPEDAILALLTAAALVAQQNSRQSATERKQTLMPLLLNAIESVRRAFPEGSENHGCSDPRCSHEH